MVWLRSRLKASSWIALVAIALQLALSFGHVHLDRISGSSDQALVDAAGTPSAATPSGGDELPAGATDECAVCALIHLANSLILSPAGTLPVPMNFAVTQHEPALAFSVVQTSLRPFQARAPPVI
jgi:hypothetical protein